MNIEIFIPIKSVGSDIEAILQQALNERQLQPFNEALISFVTDFSKSILLDTKSRKYPELVVMANYFKAVNISKLKREFGGGSAYMSRGLVFHLAPSNLDSVFLYSSLLSLLCGNINLIRISRGYGEQVQYVISKLAKLLSQDHKSLSGRFYLITYEHDDAITSLISKHCHMRVVWGGDETVKKIRSLPLRPTSLEVCFPDRFSAAMLDAEAVINLDKLNLLELCSRFFNDSIWFAQQACSSPRLVSWIGSNEKCAFARQLFWNAFNQLLPTKSYENTPGMVMDRYVSACIVASETIHCETTSLSFPTRILLKNTTLTSIKSYHCGNGLFYEQCFESVPLFFETLSDREQTLSVFGFVAEELNEYSQNLPMRAVDRITSIGHALDFDFIWDGYNLLHSFTRQISIKL